MIKILVCLTTIVSDILLIAKLKAKLISIDVTLMTRISIVVHEFLSVYVAARPRSLWGSAGWKPTSLNSFEINLYKRSDTIVVLCYSRSLDSFLLCTHVYVHAHIHVYTLSSMFPKMNYYMCMCTSTSKYNYWNRLQMKLCDFLAVWYIICGLIKVVGKC